jgi:tRNA-binding protein
MATTMSPAPIRPTISLDQIDKIDIRVGTILAVEEVINSEKLERDEFTFGHILRLRSSLRTRRM